MKQRLIFLILLAVLPATMLFAQPEAARLRLSSFPAGETESASGNGGAKHLLLSMILPGAGEWAMGHKNTAKYFLGAEALLWVGYFSTNAYVNVLQEDMESFAALHAGAQTAGKDDQFWIDVGIAENIYDFNASKLLDRDLEAIYPEGQEFDWQWDSDANRRRYVQRRLDRLDWKRRTTFMVAGMVLNRISSMVDVVRLIRKEKNSGLVSRKSFLSVSYLPNPVSGETFRMNFTYLIR